MAKAIVIGAGFGGIAAALRLRHKGYAVTIIDKQDKLGGRAYQYRRETPLGTFIHDAGPTVITAKFLFDELFELFGKRRTDYVEFRDLYPWYRIQFADGRTFDYGGTIEQMEAQIRKFGGEEDVEGFRRYLVHSRKIFDVGFTKLGAVPFHNFTTMLKCAPALIRLQNYKTVWGMAKKYIKTEHLRRVFSFQPLLVGGNPFNTTSIYSLIFYLEREWGVQFAMGGTGALVAALERLMREQGVKVRLQTEAATILTKRTGRKSRAIGVALTTGEPIHADVVVANTDTPFAYSRMLPPELRRGIAARRIDSRVAPQRYSMGLFVLYFGTTRTYPEVAHHTIVLGNSYRELIFDVFDRGRLETEDLSVYLHRPTCTDASMAPPGCESFYVLVPVPNRLSGIDYEAVGAKIRDATVRYLQRTILPGLADCIVDDFWVTPDHFAHNLNTMHGSGFSIQPTFSQSAWFRFHNKAPGIEGLYFVGAGTHPGAGMPGVLCSAKVLDHLIAPV
jgi:phytoene desaturase